MAGINKLMQIGRAVRAVRGTDETLNFSWPIRSSVAHPHKCLHEFKPGVDGVRGFAHRNVYALWRVHGICSYIEGDGRGRGGRAKGSDRNLYGNFASFLTQA